MPDKNWVDRDKSLAYLLFQSRNTGVFVIMSRRAAVPKSVRAKITEAIFAVQEEIGILVRDQRNDYAKYNYPSIDQFYERVVPIARSRGLTWVINTINPRKCDFDDNMILVDVVVDLRFKDGTEIDGFAKFFMPHPVMGAQTGGSVVSYADKYFMRNLFKIATGEGDADAFDNTQWSSGRWRRADRKVPSAVAARELRNDASESANANVPDHIPAQFASPPPAQRFLETKSRGERDQQFEATIKADALRCDTPAALEHLWRVNRVQLDRLKTDDPDRYSRILVAFGDHKRTVSADLPASSRPAMTKSDSPKAKPPPWPQQAPPPARPRMDAGYPRQPKNG